MRLIQTSVKAKLQDRDSIFFGTSLDLSNSHSKLHLASFSVSTNFKILLTPGPTFGLLWTICVHEHRVSRHNILNSLQTLFWLLKCPFSASSTLPGPILDLSLVLSPGFCPDKEITRSYSHPTHSIMPKNPFFVPKSSRP